MSTKILDRIPGRVVSTQSGKVGLSNSGGSERTPAALGKYGPSTAPAHAASKPGVPSSPTPRPSGEMATGETSGNFRPNIPPAVPTPGATNTGAEQSQAAQEGK